MGAKVCMFICWSWSNAVIIIWHWGPHSSQNNAWTKNIPFLGSRIVCQGLLQYKVKIMVYATRPIRQVRCHVWERKQPSLQSWLIDCRRSKYRCLNAWKCVRKFHCFASPPSSSIYSNSVQSILYPSVCGAGRGGGGKVGLAHTHTHHPTLMSQSPHSLTHSLIRLWEQQVWRC